MRRAHGVDECATPRTVVPRPIAACAASTIQKGMNILRPDRPPRRGTAGTVKSTPAMMPIVFWASFARGSG